MGKQPTAMDRHVGQRIRERRLVMELKQEQLAEELGISFQQLQKYEVGENRIPAVRLYEVSRKLNVDIGWFFGGQEPSIMSLSRAGREAIED